MKKNRYIFFIFLATIPLLPSIVFAQVRFQTGQSFSTPGSRFEVVAAGDINNDGREDIVAATGFYFSPDFDYHLVVYIQSSQGTFPTTRRYPYAKVYPGLNSIAIEDVNNDALNDVIIGYGDSIGIFFQNTSHSLNPQVSYYSGHSVDDIKVGDVNNDKLPDIVVCHWNESFLRVFYQTQAGFTTNIYAKPQAGYDEIQIGDVNSDGLYDVVFMAGQSNGGIHVFKQNINGTLDNYVSYFPEGGVYKFLNGIAIGDVNKDGANDIVATRGGNLGYLVIWYQDTITKLLKSPVSTQTYDIPAQIGIADFDCNGKPEIFMNHGAWDAVSVWSSDSNHRYANYDLYRVSVAQHPKPESLLAADINSDGRLDIVTVGNLTNIQLLYNVSIPTQFTKKDTSIVSKTTYSNHTNTSYFFTNSSKDTIPNFVVIRTDSFQVNYHRRQDSIRTDSIFIRTAKLCNAVYTDTVIRTHYSFANTESRDTLLWSSKTDSIRILGIPVANPDEIKVFPNPFFTQLSVLSSTETPITVNIYNLPGQRVLQQTFSYFTTIYTEHFASGFYFYELRNPKGVLKTGKMVKL